jgi:hypothetical protein
MKSLDRRQIRRQQKKWIDGDPAPNLNITSPNYANFELMVVREVIAKQYMKKGKFYLEHIRF